LRPALEELIEIRSDSILETEFNERELADFWIRLQEEYPSVAKAASYIIILFASTYLWETAFSSLLEIKNKHKACLSTQAFEPNLRISISNVAPDTDLLCRNIQSNPSRYSELVNLEGCSKFEVRFSHSFQCNFAFFESKEFLLVFRKKVYAYNK
jgi:hypothetical protein